MVGEWKVDRWEEAVWQMLQQYAEAIGVRGLAPHDLRRTCAKICQAAGGEIEQIQMLLGHASVQTTENISGRSRIWLVHLTMQFNSP